jgi:FtsZ-binding cell division protein ZapB
MMKRIGELKAEVRKLTTERDANLVDAGSLFQENARLKAEVESLRKGDERDMTTAYLYAAEQSKDTIARLKAEVERLREAGKYLCKAASHVHPNCPTPHWDWLRDAEMRWKHEAKKGGQP